MRKLGKAMATGTLDINVELSPPHTHTSSCSNRREDAPWVQRKDQFGWEPLRNRKLPMVVSPTRLTVQSLAVRGETPI